MTGEKGVDDWFLAALTTERRTEPIGINTGRSGKQKEEGFQFQTDECAKDNKQA